MSIIREKLRSNGQNLSLKIGFDSNDDFLGSQQENDNLTEFTAIDLINSVVDAEERKFKLNPVVDTSTLSFYFYNPNVIINNPTATEIYFNPLSITNLAGNNVIGQILSITFKYTIDASCDNSGSPSDPNSSTTELMFSKDNGVNWITADIVTASVAGGGDQSDSQTKNGTYTITNISDVTLVKVNGNIECSSGALGKSGGVTVTIDSATSNVGLVNVICNNTYSTNCTNSIGTQSCVGIVVPPSVPIFSFINAGFTQAEIDNNSSTMFNSFFILDFYNTYDINTQTKLFTTYLTKIGNKSQYTINASTKNQLYNLYVPVSYIEQQTGTTVNGYAKYTFYNAKYGKATLFYNQDNVSLMTSEKMYFKIKLNLINSTWEYIGTSTPNINAKQLINSTQYNDRVNNTITNTDNIRQIYPSGSTYQYTGNTYTVI